MKFIIAACAVFFAPAFADQENRDPGLLKGHRVISHEIASRTLDDSAQSFQFIKYINNDEGLAELLGTWKNEMGVPVRVNPFPGPIAMSIYNAVFAAFTQELLGACDSGQKPQLKDGFELNAFFAKTWLSLCKWPEANAMNDANLDMLYDFILGYEAPEEERFAWKSWVLTEFTGKAASEALPKMVHALLLNPYFLLEN